MQKSQRTVVITGGATGIGFAAAKRLLESPAYKVAIVGKDKELLDKAQKELGADPERATFYECDLSDAAQISKTADRILNTHKSLYGLVNNAGVYPFGGLQTTELQAWQAVMNINLTSAFLLTRALAPALGKHDDGGRIVNISSTAGLLPNHFALAYSVSKAALIALTKTLAKELGKNGITVNCICPGIVKSPLHKAYHRSDAELQEFYAKRGSAYPMGRVGTPEDIAHAIEFFLDPRAAWVTGDVMVVDGGRLLT